MSPEQRRVVFVLIDGARPDVLKDLLDRGDLPNLARWVVEPGGLGVGTSVFPSTTGVAYIPFLFGCFPGTANVPGIRWLDRGEAAAGTGWRAQWRGARSYCSTQAPWINRDINCGPSIFDLVAESLAICTPITRGLRRGAHLIPVRRALLGSLAHYAGTYPALDHAVADAWAATAAMPWRFLFVVFPGPDGLTHLNDPFHPKVLDAYRFIDRALGRFMSRLAVPPAVFVAADHGGSVMRHHRDVAVELDGWGVPALRHPTHVWRRDAEVAVMVSGNACVQLYFAPRSGRLAPLVDGQLPAELTTRLLSLDAVQLGAWRDAATPGGIVVAGPGGVERARLSEREGAVTYDPSAGDPLGLGGKVTLDDRDLLARTAAGVLPDAPRQLLQLFRSSRAGDLVLAARQDYDFRGPWEIPEHKSGHGSLIADHMLVPIAASVPLPNTPLRTVDLMPTMLEQLGIEPPAGIDGIAFSRLAQAAVVPS